MVNNAVVSKMEDAHITIIKRNNNIKSYCFRGQNVMNINRINANLNTIRKMQRYAKMVLIVNLENKENTI